MIPDGFNVWKEFDGEVPIGFGFRRMIGVERKHALGFLPKQPHGSKLFIRALSSKIIGIDDCTAGILEMISKEDHDQFVRIADEITGVIYEPQERADEHRIREGGYLRLNYPHLLKNPCELCQKYVYFPIQGEFQVDSYGSKLRFEHGTDRLLCQTMSKCPRGNPSIKDDQLWNHQMEAAFQFDLLCRNANHWPDDATVIRNKALFEEARKKSKR